MSSVSEPSYIKAKNELPMPKNVLSKVAKALLRLLWILFCEFFRGIYRFFVPPKPKDIRGQLVLVTGGANGLGRCIAHKFAELGCNIAIADILDTKTTVREIIDEFGVKCQGFNCDVSDGDAILRLKQDIESSMGTVDILVNNAGILLEASDLLQTSDEVIDKCFAVNILSHFKTVKAFLPSMIAQKRGSIVAIASMIAKISAPLATTYTSTKFAVNGFMEALYDDLCLQGNDEFIKLTTVYPGFIGTRQGLMDTLEALDALIWPMQPEYVADKTVQAVIRSKRKIVIAPSIPYLVVNMLPDRALQYIKSAECRMKEFNKEKFGTR